LKVLIRRRQGNTSTRRSGDHAQLDQEGFVYILNRLRLFTYSDCDSGESDGPTPELHTQCRQQGAIDFVQPKIIHAENTETLSCDLG
jgi:hypothetical protein